MKWALLVIAGMISTTAFADEVRQETRTRVLGENLIQVGACQDPVVNTRSYRTPVIGANGDMARMKNGDVRMKEMTEIIVTTKRKIIKCQTKENYLVNVKGSFWNFETTEIPNSGQKVSSVVAEEKTFTKSQDLDMNSLGRASGNDALFSSDNSAKLLLTIAEGLKSEAKAACEATSAELNLAVTDKASTACR